MKTKTIISKDGGFVLCPTNSPKRKKFNRCFQCNKSSFGRQIGIKITKEYTQLAFEVCYFDIFFSWKKSEYGWDKQNSSNILLWTHSTKKKPCDAESYRWKRRRSMSKSIFRNCGCSSCWNAFQEKEKNRQDGRHTHTHEYVYVETLKSILRQYFSLSLSL